MFEDERAYYRLRAEIESDRAQRAMAPEAARVHLELAEAYLGRIASVEPARTDAS